VKTGGAHSAGVRSVVGLLLAVLLPSLFVFRSRLQADPGQVPVSLPAAPNKASAPKKTSAPNQGAAPLDGRERCEKRFLSPLEQFALPTHGAEPALDDFSSIVLELDGVGAPPSASPEGWSPEVMTVTQRAVRSLSKSRWPELEAIVVTLPDPLDTGLGYAFDTDLQALVLGIESEAKGAQPISPGYLRDGAWLPWNDKPDARGVRDADGCHREFPGVMLFRGADPAKPRMLVLLVVGESPVSGVHTHALGRALTLANAMERSAHGSRLAVLRAQADFPGLRILGPTFSGSAGSLRRVLDQHPELPVQLVSGTASGPDVSRILGADWSAPETRTSLRAGTRYQATTVPERALECSFLHYAVRAGAATNPRQPGVASPVDGVAVLRESGTEFGGGKRAVRKWESPKDVACDLRPEIQLSFPFHVSSIRNAYAELDDKSPAGPAFDTTLARHTSLDIQLRGGERSDMEMPQSETTKFAQDLALGHVLGEIEREGVRWVGIQATDTADAIFLARKIRDVAPDVRIGFFGSDALFSHPTFRNDLLGSLVVTPYPFLGADHFRDEAPDPHRVGSIEAHGHASFPNGDSEGIFNAAMVLRGAAPTDLSEYAFIRPARTAVALRNLQPLPVWIAAIGRTGLVPLQARPSLDCHGTIFGATPQASLELCTSSSPSREAWARFNQLRELELHLDPDVMPPRFWHVVLAALLLGFLLHHYRVHERQHRELEKNSFPADKADKAGKGDALLDRCIVRTKWRLYAAFARLTLCLAVSYMVLIYVVAVWVYLEHDQGLRLLIPMSVSAAASVGFGVFVCGDLRALVKDVVQFRGFLLRCNIMTSAGLPSADLLPDAGWRARAELWLGMDEPTGSKHECDRLIYVSFAHVRMLASVGLLVMILFCAAAVAQVASATDATLDEGLVQAATTLFALRNVPFTNGVSTSAPILLSLCCVYVWAVGRMQRLRTLHALSMCTEQDGLWDGVSTPICSILYGARQPGAAMCEEGKGFAEVERGLVNAVLRPSGRAYFAALLSIGTLPTVLFFLLQPTTLETVRATQVMFGVLGSCAMLTCATLVQLMLYRKALSRLLERIMAHPLGASFRFVAAPIRESVDAQVSGVSDPVVRLAACEQLYRAILNRPRTAALALTEHGEKLAGLRAQALGGRVDIGALAKDEPAPAVALARELQSAARSISLGLRHRWQKLPPPLAWSVATQETLQPSESQPEETFVVTVVAMLINRHVSQFRHFLGVTTGCSLLLLLAVTSYPFEPHRALMTGMWMLVLAVVTSSLAVFVSLDRAPLLRFIAGEVDNAGTITWSFELVRRVVLWGVVPVLIVLAAQYPELAHELAKLVQPFMFSVR
jgi:hypothetical protein